MTVSKKYFEEIALVRKRVKIERNLDINKPEAREVKRLEDIYSTKMEYCSKSLRTSSSNKGAGIDVSTSLRNTKLKGNMATSSKESNESMRCKLFAELEYLSNFLKLMRKYGGGLCKSNSDVAGCEDWIKRNIPLFERKIVAVKHAIRSLTGDINRDLKIFNKVPFHDTYDIDD